eukprot:jgi/Phyca11/110676/e_gw1.18.312.1
MGPLVDRPTYDIPKGILKREGSRPKPEVAAVAVKWADPECKIENRSNPVDRESIRPMIDSPKSPIVDQPLTGSASVTVDDPKMESEVEVSGTPEDDEVCYHEGKDLIVEDLENQMAILPEVSATTEEVKIEHIQIEEADGRTPEQIDRLRQIIWKRRHLLIGEGNALPPAARGAVCDIDVGNATPVAQRVRRVALQFREKLSDLIKGLLSAGIITHSTSPWASPIVVIIKKNGVDIRLCIDYRADQESTKLIDVFEDGEPDPELKPSVLGRRSYIDDILITSSDWDDLCEQVERLLDTCDQWNLSISVVKSFWGYSKVAYLGHQVTVDKEVLALLRMLDVCYTQLVGRSIKVLSRHSTLAWLLNSSGLDGRLGKWAALLSGWTLEIVKCSRGEDEILGTLAASSPEDDRWARAITAFTLLKAKIVATPILRHFDPDRGPVVVLYASQWAISAALMQEHEGVYWPVTFTSRTLKTNELNYSTVDKEVLALLRMLDVCYTQLVGRPIKVLSRHSTLAWLLNSSGLDGRLGKWAALLSGWTLEIVKCSRGEDEILGTLAASITPRSEMDDALIAIAPRKQPRKLIVTPPPTVELDEDLLVVSFDGSASVKRKAGAFSAVIWKLPEWTVVSAASRYAPAITVNEAEYHGLLLGLDLLPTSDRGRIVICGDSNLIIRQMRGEIDCKAPKLQLLRQKAMDQLKVWPKHEFLHVKREWNQSADKLANAALQQESGEVITSDADRQDLITINRLDEILRPKEHDAAVHVSAVTRAAGRRRQVQPEILQEAIVQQMRVQRIIQAQDEEVWIVHMKAYLRGDVINLSAEDAKACAKIASEYDLDESGLLLYCPTGSKSNADRDPVVRVVVPETLQPDFLHHYHVSLEGGHQGIGRTYERIRKYFHRRGLFKSVQKYVGECVDCETGKGRPLVQGESPGNIQATYPFQVIAMDHIPSLPKSFKGNTELLIWVDLFTGYVIAKASGSRTAQTIAENYEESVFRRFGASEVIRHDREPGFMADFFRAFNRIIGHKQSPTMAYRPQSNGSAERKVQTLTRSLKMYVADVDQRDWDEYAERLTFALNTAHDRTRGDTPFYLAHGWDPRSTLEAALPIGITGHRDRDARRWRNHIQEHYQRAREHVNERLRDAIRSRADRHNEEVRPHKIETGSQVWLYLDRVKVGYAKKLAHMWHGPFRVAELIGNHAARLEITGNCPDRPKTRLVDPDADRFDFDEAFLPEDSWETVLEDDEYEVERIVDVRSGRRTRYGRVHREFLVHWKGYEEPTWVDEADLNCGALLREFERKRANRNRFNAMQSHEEDEGDPSQ